MIVGIASHTKWIIFILIEVDQQYHLDNKYEYDNHYHLRIC
jgi:hypothetical protein